MQKIVLAALLALATTHARAAGVTGPLQSQASLGEIAANGPAAQSTARTNLGLGNIATLNLGTGLSSDGVNLNAVGGGGGGSIAVPSAALLGGNGTSLNGVTVSTGLALSGGNLTVGYGTVAGTAAQGNDSRINGALQTSAIPTASLLGGAASALTPITLGGGLALSGGVLSTTGSGLTVPSASVLSGNGTALTAANAAAIEAVLGYTPVNPANNGTDFTSPSAVRTNLGLGSIAALAVPGAANLLGSNGNNFVGITTQTGLALSGGNLSVVYGTATGTAAAGNDPRILGAVQATSIPSANLLGGNGSSLTPVTLGSGLSLAGGVLSNTSTGLSVPTSPLLSGTGSALAAASAGSVTSVLGYTPLNPANNGSDFAAVGTVRSNLGLGSLATMAAPASSPLLGSNGAGFSAVATGTGLSLSAGSLSVLYGTSATTAAAGNDSRIAGAYQAAAIPSASLLKGTPSALAAATSTDIAAVLGYSPVNPANNGSDFASAATTRSNLGLGTAATLAIPSASGLLGSSGSNFTPVSTGSGLALASNSLAVVYGTTAGTSAAGNDSRIAGAYQAASIPSASLLKGGSSTLSAAGPTDVEAALGYTPINPSNNGSDFPSASSVRSNLGLGTLATLAIPASTNLLGSSGSGLTSVAAGTGLALASNSLSVAYGTTSSTAAAGNDSRITGAYPTASIPAGLIKGTAATSLSAATSADITGLLGYTPVNPTALPSYGFTGNPTISSTLLGCTDNSTSIATDLFGQTCFASQFPSNPIQVGSFSTIGVVPAPAGSNKAVVYAQDTKQWYDYEPIAATDTISVAQVSGQAQITIAGTNTGIAVGGVAPWVVSYSKVPAGTIVTAVTISGSNTLLNLSSNLTSASVVGDSVSFASSAYIIEPTPAATLTGTVPTATLPLATPGTLPGAVTVDPGTFGLVGSKLVCTSCLTLSNNFTLTGGTNTGTPLTVATNADQPAPSQILTFANSPAITVGEAVSGSTALPAGAVVASVQTATVAGVTTTTVYLTAATSYAITNGTSLVFTPETPQIVDYNALPEIRSVGSNTSLQATCMGDSRCAGQSIYSLQGVAGASPPFTWAVYGSNSPLVMANAFLGDSLNMDMLFGYVFPLENKELKYVIANGGSGYTTPPTAVASTNCTGSTPGTATIANGAVTSVAIGTSGTCGYPPGYLTFTGGGGTGASAEVITGYGGSFGISGQTSADMVARLADVVASPADIIDLWCCTNDTTSTAPIITAAQSKTNWQTIVDTLLAAGKTVIAHTDGARTQLAPITGTNISVTGAQASYLANLDNFKRGFAREQGAQLGLNSGLVLSNDTPLIADPTSATGEPIPGLLKEGLHPSSGGAAAMGWKLAQVLGPRLNLAPNQWSNTQSTSEVDAYDVINNPYGFIGASVFDPFMNNAGGSMGSTGCAGTIAMGATLATFANPSGGAAGLTEVCSGALPARSDGYPGTTQHLSVSSHGGLFTTNSTQTVHTTLTSTGACPAGLVVGDVIHGGSIPGPTAPNPSGGSPITAVSAGSPCVVTINNPTTALDGSISYTFGPPKRWYRWEVGSNQATLGIVSTTANSTAAQPAANQVSFTTLPAGMAVGQGMTGGSIPANLPPAIIQTITGTGPYVVTLNENTTATDASGTTYTYADRIKCQALFTFGTMTNVNYLDFKFSQIAPSTFASQVVSEWGQQNGDFWPNSTDTLRSPSGRAMTLSTYPVMVPPSTGTTGIELDVGFDGSAGTSAAPSAFIADFTNVACRRTGPLETR